ncbi:MAG TPA: hypothetical protein C5S37_06820 [Methanophagales archaeon]|nr:hypothetical protein [Methanophagales archaeon]
MIKTFKKSFIKNASHTDMPRLLEPLKRGEADFVLGSRFKGEIKKGEVVINCQAKIYMMKN